MAEYEDGERGAVENESYCMPSMEKRNTESMNMAMGYHNGSDLANAKPFPVAMVGAKRNEQNGPKMPGENKYNYNADRK